MTTEENSGRSPGCPGREGDFSNPASERDAGGSLCCPLLLMAAPGITWNRTRRFIHTIDATRQLSLEVSTVLQDHEVAEEAEDAYAYKQFLRAYLIAPWRYPELSGIDAPTMTIGSAWRDKREAPSAGKLHEAVETIAVQNNWTNNVVGVHLQVLSLTSENVAGASDGTVSSDAAAGRFIGVQPTISWHQQSDLEPRITIGSTPLSGPVSPTIQGTASTSSALGNVGRISGEAYRKPITDSITSYIGMADSTTDQIFGRVIEDGAQLNIDYPIVENWDASIASSLGVRNGHNVGDNLHRSAEIAIAYDFKPTIVDAFTIGTLYSFDGYAHNSNIFAPGFGGYYSPHSDESLAVDVDFRTKEGRRAILKGDMLYGRERLHEEGSTIQYGAAIACELGSAVLIAEHWLLSAQMHVEHSQQYHDFYAGVSVIYALSGRTSVLSTDVQEDPFQ